MENQTVYSDTARAIVKALSASDKPMYMAQISEATGLDIKPGHLTAAVKKGLIVKTGEEEFMRPSKRKIGVFTLGEIDDDAKLTDNEKAIIDAAKSIGEFFTCADLSDKLGKKAIVGSLVKKGILVRDHDDEVESTSKAKRSLYTVAEVLPEDF